jgi:hypothetical protein
MPFAFEIRPISLEEGFHLRCEEVLGQDARHSRLIDAIVHAAQLGRDRNGEIRIFDSSGRIAEVLPLPVTQPNCRPTRHLHENHH